MMTRGVNYNYNHIYVNENKIYPLRSHGDKWGFDTFLIDAKHLRKGKNTFKVTARNKSGGITGNVDDIWVRDPIIIYPVS